MTDEPNHPQFKLNAKVWAIIALLAILIAGSYAKVWRAEFVDLDDQLHVFGNPYVLNGLNLTDLKWASRTATGGFWMPLTWLSFQADAQASAWLFGDVGPSNGISASLPNATLYHLDNIFLHILAASILFLFLFRMTRFYWPSAQATFLWALHPLRVESVAWVTERKDVLSAVFGFLALYLYLSWAEARKGGKPAYGRYFAVCAAMAASLSAKATFLTLPALFLMIDCWPLGRLKNVKQLPAALVSKLPMMAMSILIAIATMLAQRRIGKLNLSQDVMAENAIVSYARYVWMQFDFHGLTILYPFEAPTTGMILGAIAFLAILTGICIWQMRRRPWLLFGWLWYLGTAFPTIGFVHRGSQGYADRYTYLPSVGLFIMLALAIPPKWFQPPRLAWTAAFGMAISACLAVATALQAGYWRNSVTLFEHERDVASPNNTGHSALGTAYERAGRFDEAIKEFQGIKPITHLDAPPESSVAGVYLLMNRPDLALYQSQLAINNRPDMPDCHYMRGTALVMLNRREEAIIEFEKTLSLDADFAPARESLQRLKEN